MVTSPHLDLQREEENRIKDRRLEWTVKSAYLGPTGEVPVREIEAHVFVDPLDVLVGSEVEELLVRVPRAGRARPDLQLDAVRRVSVWHICTLHVRCLNPMSEGW